LRTVTGEYAAALADVALAMPEAGRAERLRR